MTPPTIYLTNAGTVIGARKGAASCAGMVGPGPVLSIMRHPRPEYGEAGAGRVLAFTPTAALLAAAQAGREVDEVDAWARYEAALVERWAPNAFPHRPGELTAFAEVHRGGAPWDGSRWSRLGPVEDGSILVCACGREAAAAGRCHRVTAARFLAAASWRVVLDGVELERRAA